MRALSILVLVVAICTVSASAELVPSGHNMMWEDYFGDWHDSYVEARQGDSFGLSIRANYTPDPAAFAQGGLTNVSWDPAAMHVIEDPTGSYWRQYYDIRFDYYGTGVFETQWYDWNPYGTWYQIGEGQYVNRVWVTIEPDAPLGTSLIGLRQAMVGYLDGINVSFITDAVIPRDGTDPWAMQVNVLPALPTYDPGDFDGSTHVDDIDIDLLCDFIRDALPYDLLYDISGSEQGVADGFVDTLDLDYLVRFLVEISTSLDTGTEYGDFNLDGVVDTTDLTRMATNYGADDWTWDDGNANRYIDTDIDNTDLTILATYYGFGEPDIVPEPASAGLLLLGASAVLRRRRKA